MTGRATLAGALALALLVAGGVAADDHWRGDYNVADGSSPQAIQLAEYILTWQLPHGGWSKGIAFQDGPWRPGMPKSTQVNRGVELGSFDDGKTIAEMKVLATVYRATGDERFKEGFLRGLDFVFAAQYPTGGWPQSYPQREGYSDNVTYNDGAMINVLRLVRDVARSPLYDFVGPEYRARAEEALRKGIDYILRSQIEVDGVLTAWGQQHDPFTYEPAHGRSFELPSITAGESVGVVEFLMELPDPGPEIRRAILSALLWFERVRLPDGRWARFYEIGTDRPFFVPRSGEKLYDYNELPLDARGYAWYGTWPAGLVTFAFSTGYARDLWLSLDDFPIPWIEIDRSMTAAGTSLAGVVPLGVEVLSKAEGEIERVVVEIDGEVYYEGASLPERGALLLDTRALSEGSHTLTVTAHHRRLGVFSRAASFTVRNWWRLTESFKAPEDAGWFGTVDYLRARERSEGWSYATGEAAAYFGDPDRMVAPSDGGYLVWETPHLKRFEFDVYTTAEAVSDRIGAWGLTPGGEWLELGFEERLEGASGGLRHVKIAGEVDEGVEITQFKLAVGEAGGDGELQLGAALLTGLVDRLSGT